jgi:hypothetical protein
MSLKEYLVKEKPSLSQSSITTYHSILKSLYNKVFQSNDIDIIRLKDETVKILDYLKDLPFNKRKTTLSALLIINPNEKRYRDLMLDDIHTYNQEEKKQTMNEKQEENWITEDEIKHKWELAKKNAMLLYKKHHLSSVDLQDIQSFVILSLLSGIFIPPRRLLDYCEPFKIKNIDKEKDNFIDKNNLVFHTYKTAKYYGKQEVAIPLVLKKILQKWITVNPTDYLLFDSQMKPLSSVKLNQRLVKLFDNKKIGVNMLRHIYLSTKYQPLATMNKDLENDFKQMGSSIAQTNVYIKKT